MSVALKITVSDNASPAIARVKEAMVSSAGKKEMGAAVALTVKDHLGSLPPNKSGWHSTGFWKDAVRATQYRADDDGFTISIHKIGVRQRLLGGTIEPVNASMLAIPANDEAYGHTPGEFDNLRFALLGGHPALIEAESDLVKIGKKGVTHTGSTIGRVMFWLARSVDQDPDPTVLPERGELIDSAKNAAVDYLARTLHREGGEE